VVNSLCGRRVAWITLLSRSLALTPAASRNIEAAATTYTWPPYFINLTLHTMHFRRPIPLLLLLASPCLIAAKDTLSNDEILALGHARPKEEAIAAAEGAKATQSPRRYVGTEDAPVDGLDGKPHAGPFVDTTPEQSSSATVSVTASTKKALPTLLEKFAGEGADIPEKNDGVMNDEGRVKPKKGTTGTEGGVSEKDKVKLAKGGNVENKPQSPVEAPPLPHSEEKHMETKEEKAEKPLKEEKDTDSDYNAGLEKPTDLPDKPHNIPHPAGGSSKDNPSSKEPWLQETLPYTEGSINPKKATSAIASNALPIGGAMDDHETWHEWFHSFGVSFTMIIFTEIGDKTFLVAALMAMRHDRLTVFTAALAALGLMTVLSAVLGHIAPTLLPKRLTTLAAAMLFLFFGAKMLREGLEMDREAGVGEEMREVEQELEEKEHDLARRDRKNSNPHSLESGRLSSRSPSPSKGGHSHGAGGLTNLLSLLLSPAWVQTFIMTFLGEWGDRSQIATIAMAAGQDYWWVTLGAISGHACCTGLAVLGGRALAGKVSMRVGKL
jgi:putative Ca2+/H+ antiporter (TMEM165/GDT1 family)